MEPTPERHPAAAAPSDDNDDNHRDGRRSFQCTSIGAWPADSDDADAETAQTQEQNQSEPSPTVSDIDDDDAYETAPDEAGDGHTTTGIATRNAQPCPPPFWTRHRRDPSSTSASAPASASTRPLIRLEDHTQDTSSRSSSGLWARSVTIEDSVVVKGKTGVGAYTVWICRVQMLEGGVVTVRMRYSEFVELRARLYEAFPYARHSLPELPPKSAFMKFNSKFLRKRREGLAYFLNCVLLNPEFSGAPVLKEFLFARV